MESSSKQGLQLQQTSDGLVKSDQPPSWRPEKVASLKWARSEEPGVPPGLQKRTPKPSPEPQPAGSFRKAPDSHDEALELKSRSISESPDSNFSVENTLALTFFAVVLFGMLIATVFFGDEDADNWNSTELGLEPQRFGEHPVSPKSQHKIKEKEKVKAVVKEMEKEGKERAAAADHTANTKANLVKLASIHSAGTWAKTYRTADQGSKEALELLFRCNIIPMQEFSDAFVSQEHIDECVWISSQMLRQRSLDEWVELCPQANRTFEESVTACFAARTDVIASLYEGSQPGTPVNLTPRSDLGQIDCRTPGNTPGPANSSTPPEQRSKPATMTSLAEEQIPPTAPRLGGQYRRTNSGIQSINCTTTPPDTSMRIPDTVASGMGIPNTIGSMRSGIGIPDTVGSMRSGMGIPDTVGSMRSGMGIPDTVGSMRSGMGIPDTVASIHDTSFPDTSINCNGDGEFPDTAESLSEEPSPQPPRSYVSTSGTLPQSRLSQEPERAPTRGDSVVARCREIMADTPTRGGGFSPGSKK